MDIKQLEKKHIKRFDQHNYRVDLELLNKQIPKLLEIRSICQKVAEVDTPEKTEEILNKRSGFVNTQLSFSAYGFDNEYKRIQQLEKEINGILTLDDITEKGKLKRSKEDEIRSKYIEYYSAEEYAQKEELERIVKEFNLLPHNVRKTFAIDLRGELRRHPGYRK